jgi:hypothetical protein
MSAASKPGSVQEPPTFECPVCVGRGWWSDHEPACYEAGECIGCDGVQTPCENCYGTGQVTEEGDESHG